MKFDVIASKIKTRELLASQVDLEVTLDLMSRFMIDDDGEPIDQARAKEILLDTDLEELLKAQEDFLAAFNLRKKNGAR